MTASVNEQSATHTNMLADKRACDGRGGFIKLGYRRKTSMSKGITMHKTIATIVTCCLFCQVAFSADVPELTKDNFAKWRDYIVPSEEERAWEKIPWRLSLTEAVTEARKTKKPILFWGMNGHPFANVCHNGVIGRMRVYSDKELQRLSDSFVVVADDAYRLDVEEYPGKDFFKKVVPVGGQGTYCFSPSGILIGKSDGHDVEFLQRSLVKWNSMSDREKFTAVKNTGGSKPEDKIYPNSGLVLHSHSRDLPRSTGAVSREWNQDFAWFQKDEARRFLPPQVKADQAWDVPQFLVHRLARFHLIDYVHGQCFYFEENEIKKARLTTHIIEVKQGIAHLEFEGETLASTEGQYRKGYDARLLGNAQYHVSAQKFVSFELVACGSRWGHDEHNGRDEDLGPAPMGVAFGLASKKPQERFRPAWLSGYNWETSMLRNK